MGKHWFSIGSVWSYEGWGGQMVSKGVKRQPHQAHVAPILNQRGPAPGKPVSYLPNMYSYYTFPHAYCPA